MNNKTETNELIKNFKELKSRIRKIKRSPKIGEIYKIYSEQQELTIRRTTLERQNKVYILYIAPIESFRADDLEPLYIQEHLLKKLFIEKKYTTLLYTTRLLVTLLDFSKACNLISSNPLKEIYTLPIIMKSQREMNRLLVHRPTLSFENLRYELMQVIKTFKNTSVKRQLLLEISLRTILSPREVCSLKIDDLNLFEHILIVRNTKTLIVFKIQTSERLEKIILKSYNEFGSKTSRFVFSGSRNKNSSLSPQTLNRALKDLGFKKKLCAHGIRSVASNYFSSHVDQIHPYVAEAMLQHSVGTKVSRAYRRDDYYNERIKASKLWNDFLDGIYRQLKLM